MANFASRGRVLTLALVLFVLFFLLGKSDSSKTSFVNIAREAGLERIVPGAGASWADYDGDGLLDLLVPWGPVNLFKNNGDGTFADVTEEAGLSSVCCSARSAVFADYDNDGHPDLYISHFGSDRTLDDPGAPDQLFHNNGDGTFTEMTKEAGINCEGHGEGVAWVDFNKDGFLDVYVANYGVYDSQTGEYVSDEDCFFKNNGDGTFTNISEETGVTGIPEVNRRSYEGEGHPRRSLSFQPVWFDYDNDGWDDLFVATDFGASPLYKNNGDGSFADVTEEAGLNIFGTGMGVSAEDFDNNGYLDIYVTNEGPNYLWKNSGNGTFMEVAQKTGATDERIGWGTAFFDYDNDGDLDLYIVNGLAYNEEDGDREKFLSKDSFFENSGGKFRDVTDKVGINDSVIKRGAAFGDFDNNGFIDIVTVPRSKDAEYGQEHPLRLYKNLGNKNSWITLRLVGTKSNRDGIGAKVWVTAGGKTQYQQVIAGSSYASQNSIWPHFGLGKVKKVDKVEILWPSGVRQVLKTGKVNQILQVKENEN